MADINLPTFASGNVIDPDLVMPVFYEDALASILSSLQTVNGALDGDNLDAGLVITQFMTQKGSFLAMDGSSGTANLDYRKSWFGNLEWSVDLSEFNRTDQIQAIPGACRSEYCKWPALALVTWTVFWEWNNTDDNTERSLIRLYVDDVAQDSSYRVAGRLGSTKLTPEGYVKSRLWTGHRLVELTQGWHDIGLKIQASKTYTTRIHSCSIDVLQLKYGTAA